MSKIKIPCLILSLLLGLLLSCAGPVAQAEETPDLRERTSGELSMVVMGDSYSAGNGAGAYIYEGKEKRGKTYRSRNCQ